MAKFSKPFSGAPDGAIYPVNYAAGDDCPPELQKAAVSLDALAFDADPGKVEQLQEPSAAVKAKAGAPENK